MNVNISLHGSLIQQDRSQRVDDGIESMEFHYLNGILALVHHPHQMHRQ
jgi:hypothetical protein